MKNKKRKMRPGQKSKRASERVINGLGALDSVYREKWQRYTSFVATIQNLAPIEKAEAWLSYVSGDFEDFGEQEALVYLTSRQIGCSRQVAALIARWREDERRVIEASAGGHLIHNFDIGKSRRIRTRTLAEASQIETLSPYELRDFWFARREGELTIDATMLRTVSWCGIGGFEPWWRRLAKETAQLFMQGGLQRPALGDWIFNMCRSDYAVSLMQKTLERALDDLELSEYGQTWPWTFCLGYDNPGDPAVDHIPYASSVVFSNLVLRPEKRNEQLVLAAIGSLQKHQDVGGSWPYWAKQGEGSSVEAMAMHATALLKPAGYDRMLSLGTEYLLKQQQLAGCWDEPGSPDAVYLTVLVLDAIELANGGTKVTFRLPGSPASISSELGKSRVTSLNKRRFSVALTFPGEIRAFVKPIADRISQRTGKEKIFYDNYHEAELARPDLDTHLQSIYHDDSDLIVVFSGANYDKKEWCRLEWRGVRDLIKQRRGQDVMIIRMDETMLPGIYSIDGFIDARGRNTEEIAGLILKRMSVRV